MNEQIKKNAVLSESAKLSEKDSVLSEVSKGLTVLQVERLRELTENVSFDSNFKATAEKIKSKYIVEAAKPAKEAEVITEESNGLKTADPRIVSLTNAMKQIRK